MLLERKKRRKWAIRCRAIRCRASPLSRRSANLRDAFRESSRAASSAVQPWVPEAKRQQVGNPRMTAQARKGRGAIRNSRNTELGLEARTLLRKRLRRSEALTTLRGNKKSGASVRALRNGPQPVPPTPPARNTPLDATPPDATLPRPTNPGQPI